MRIKHNVGKVVLLTVAPSLLSFIYMKKKMTLEELARMVQRGFQDMGEFRKGMEEFRAEMEEFRAEVNEKFRDVHKKIDALYGEVKEVKSSLPPLIRNVAVLEIEVHDLRERLKRVEKKVGVGK